MNQIHQVITIGILLDIAFVVVGPVRWPCLHQFKRISAVFESPALLQALHPEVVISSEVRLKFLRWNALMRFLPVFLAIVLLPVLGLCLRRIIFACLLVLILGLFLICLLLLLVRLLLLILLFLLR